MALRSPIYLDIETLLSQAEYHEIDVPRPADIVEKTVRKRTGGGKVGISRFGANASTESDFEYQSTYHLEPKEKATVSKVIDALIEDEVINVDPTGTTTLSKDDLVQIEGVMRVTTASLAGKMFYIFRRLMDAAEGGLDTIFDLEVEDPQVVDQLKRVYLRNELLPIPILLEMVESQLPQKVYINVRPDYFIDEASANRIEGEGRVLGSIRQLIPGGDEGYLSADEWLLHDWEHTMRRILMTKLGDTVELAVGQFGLDLPAEDVHAFVSGPAIAVDAIALY
jgi:hypothetical protein